MRRFLLIGLAAGLGLTGCSRTYVEELDMVVAPNTTPCSDGMGGTRECLLVKSDRYGLGYNEWFPFNASIQGFDYQTGYRYHLIVNETSYSTAIGDPAPPSYALKQVLEKTPDSTIAVPGQP